LCGGREPVDDGRPGGPQALRHLGVRILRLILFAVVFVAVSRLSRIILMRPDGCWPASASRD
ncbi:MAG: hypothetical protein ACKVIN_11305, partial [Longimicrobiales bacterium]